MAHAQRRNAALAEFKKTFGAMAPYRHRYELFRDFVTMVACSLHNGLMQCPKREEEYRQIIAGYKKQDQEAFGKLQASLVLALDPEPRDILGPLYMELEVANRDVGQFFTPPEISELMAQITFAPLLSDLEEKPFITAGEPACGSGGMILSLVKLMTQAGHDPMKKLWVQAIDVDRTVALMCYVQLSLWNVPAEIIVGNTLSWEIREVWYTPAHHLGLWEYRLTRLPGSTEVRESNPDDPQDVEPLAALSPRSLEPETQATMPEQLGFNF